MADKTLRALVEEFAYKRTEDVAQQVERFGDDVEFCGYRGFEDNSNMVKGSVLASIISLAIYRYKKGDERYRKDLQRVNDFAGLFAGAPTATWGKRSLLSGLVRLYDAGLYSELSGDALKIYTEATDYTDFLDPETLVLKKSIPTNYYHVAMACAAYRERLGMENNGVSERLLSKMLGIMDNYSTEGWADEAPGYGRFDSYSVDGPGEMLAPLMECGREIPERLMKSMQKSVDLCLALKNAEGHGFMYGRSLAVHGDQTPLSVLVHGMNLGLIPEKDMADAKSYIVNTVKKITEFWYDSELGAVNIWLGGRATNGYRNITRILEVDNNARLCLMRVLDTAERFGFADTPIENTDIGYTDRWECREFPFDKSENSTRTLFVLRRHGKVFGLPFINGGKSHGSASYLTFPASTGYIEAPPEAVLDFLVPRFTLKDGSVVIPKCFWESVRAENGDDFCIITAKGSMTDGASQAQDYPVKSDKSFEAVFEFSGDRIKVTYTAPGVDVLDVRMMYSGNASVRGTGFDMVEALDVSDARYNAWHGAPEKGMQWTGHTNTAGYEIVLA